ncbi:MAG: hypothetical protein WCR19_03595 [Acholeplasmataceae bacterium]
MKNYIDKYVFAVTKRLPENQREEVKKDLESNIYEMLSENPSDLEIDEVLHNLGNPRVIAQNYLGEQKHVIDPLFYNDYITTLKIVLIIFGCIAVLATTLDSLINVGDLSIFEIFVQMISNIFGSLFDSLFICFSIVTLVFWGMSQPKSKEKILKNWKLKDLPDIAKPDKVTINRISIIIEFMIVSIISIFFIIVLMFYSNKIGWYENSQLVVTIFSADVIKAIVPYLIISLVLDMIVYLMKIKYLKYNVKMVVIHAISQLLGLTAFVVLINHPDFINVGFIDYLSTYVNMSYQEISYIIEQVIVVITIVAIVSVCIDLISHIVKLYKTKKKETN